MKIRKAFTLAETLVTLAIIGVIAAITVPGLKKSSEEKEIVAQVKKNFSVLSQATELVTNEYGPIRRWDSSKWTEYYAEHLNYIKKCPPEKGCFYDGMIIFPNGKNDVSYGDNGYVLADGTTVHFSGIGSIEGYGLSPEDVAKAKYTMRIDLNGPKKPNMWGYDIWLLVLVDGKGLVPSGAYSEEQCRVLYGCVSHVLAKNEIDIP